MTDPCNANSYSSSIYFISALILWTVPFTCLPPPPCVVVIPLFCLLETWKSLQLQRDVTLKFKERSCTRGNSQPTEEGKLFRIPLVGKIQGSSSTVPQRIAHGTQSMVNISWAHLLMVLIPSPPTFFMVSLSVIIFQRTHLHLWFCPRLCFQEKLTEVVWLGFLRGSIFRNKFFHY